ncbi:MAG: hypothetical protein IKJ43_03780 [Bacilli bacterium]|nr:hypothetical protein [Bacilli bacterium]
MVIGTFNVDNKIFENNINGEKRMDKLISFINGYDLSILGIQELSNSNKRYLEKKLKDYKIYGHSKGGFSFNDEYNSIIMKKDFTHVKSKTYALSKKIDKVGSKFLFSLFPRICTVVHFKYDNHYYMMINTQLSSFVNRNKEIDALNKIILRERKKDEFLIITIDFNGKINDRLKWFITENGLKVVKFYTKRKIYGIVDNILLSKNIKIISKRTVGFNEIKISKHNPSVVRISVKD